jgi:NADPH:quinone reductase-like Zn-dependent oxidoreductase
MDSLLSRATPGRKSVQFHAQAVGTDLEILAHWVEQGKLKPIVSHVYPLEQIVEAHRHCETRRTVGKIAITIR